MAVELTLGVGRRAFEAMSCTGRVVVVADRPEPLLDHVERRLVELERRWSRFRPDSEISGLNDAGGSPRQVSHDTVRLVEALVRAWQLTDGAFDPTLLGTLVELGYAASRTDATVRTSLAQDARPVGRPDLVLVDHDARVVQLPPGTVLDPGGLGKGLAADLLVLELIRLGAGGALVEIGGDLRVAGEAPASDGWPIEIRSDLDGTAADVALRAGGVATSSSRLRTWRTDGEQRHHLLDPRSRRPTDGDVVACTVIAGSAATAEAFTKLAFVEGGAAAMAAYGRHGLAARVTTEDGAVLHSDAWTVFAR